MEQLKVLIENFQYITPPMLVMWAIGGVLIYLAIAKEMEPTLLLPMGFGAILVNLPIALGIGCYENTLGIIVLFQRKSVLVFAGKRKINPQLNNLADLCNIFCVKGDDRAVIHLAPVNFRELNLIG